MPEQVTMIQSTESYHSDVTNRCENTFTDERVKKQTDRKRNKYLDVQVNKLHSNTVIRQSWHTHAMFSFEEVQ